MISPLSQPGRIARIADSNCPSRRRELRKIPPWRRDAVRLRAICGPRLTGFPSSVRSTLVDGFSLQFAAIRDLERLPLPLCCLASASLLAERPEPISHRAVSRTVGRRALEWLHLRQYQVKLARPAVSIQIVVPIGAQSVHPILMHCQITRRRPCSITELRAFSAAAASIVRVRRRSQ